MGVYKMWLRCATINKRMQQQKILVIEDSAYLAESLKDALELHGYEPLIAPNGKVGIRIALEHHPDLILLDIRLPDISGYDVFHTIRKDSWGKNAKISILTASEGLETISKNVDLPLSHILFKPTQSLSSLLSHIKERLAHKL